MAQNNDICAICHETIINNDDCTYTPCFHKYHSKCLALWIEKFSNNTCPLCNSSVSARNSNSPIIFTPVENETSNCCLVNKYVLIVAIGFGIIAIVVIVVLALI